MLTTLNGMFAKPKPHKIDFIKENKRKLKEVSNMVNQNHSKSRFGSAKSKGSQTEVSNSRPSSTCMKENRNMSSSCKLSTKSSMAVFLHEKKDKGNISNVSLSPKQKSSGKVGLLKNQSCQTIDPRRCDQLFYDGVIKYPSNKVIQKIAEIKKQKANRLDAHVKKEYYRRNKIKQKSSEKFILPVPGLKASGKGDEGSEVREASDLEEDEYAEEETENTQPEQPEPEPEPEPEIINPPIVQKVPQKPSSQGQQLRASEIIKKTTEEHFSPRKNSAEPTHKPNSNGDAKPVKKPYKRSAKEDEILKTVLDPQCPPGHIPLPDHERKKTLHMLRVSHAELVREMNLLPVRTDTLRVRQRKIQLESQLNKIEEGIKVFNKSKVYVKIEE